MLFFGHRDFKWNICVGKITVIQHVQTAFLDTLQKKENKFKNMTKTEQALAKYLPLFSGENNFIFQKMFKIRD